MYGIPAGFYEKADKAGIFMMSRLKSCLWHTACVENGCAELCRLFCDVDDVTYAP